MRATVFLVAAALGSVPFVASPALAQGSDSSESCIQHSPVSQPGGANYEDQRYQGLRNWYGVHLANNCRQQVVAQVCITGGSGQQQCNVIRIYPGHTDDYGFPDSVPGPVRYTVNTCFETTMAQGRCDFQQQPAPFVPYYNGDPNYEPNPSPGYQPPPSYQPPYYARPPYYAPGPAPVNPQYPYRNWK